MDKLAVVILNWNGCELLEKYLPSVLKYSSIPEVSVYVIDNGSKDESINILNKKFPVVKIINNINRLWIVVKIWAFCDIMI